jgi:hypothetical protein
VAGCSAGRATAQGDQRDAVRLLAEASRTEWQNALDPHERSAFAEDLAALRREVPEGVFDTAWRIGAARTA